MEVFMNYTLFSTFINFFLPKSANFKLILKYKTQDIRLKNLNNLLFIKFQKSF